MMTDEERVELDGAADAFEQAYQREYGFWGDSSKHTMYKAPGQYLVHKPLIGQPSRHAWVRGRVGDFVVGFDATPQDCIMCGGSH